MNKNTFMSEVRKRLDGISDADIKRSLDYYEEMIDDRIEDGEGEEEAVAAMGTVGEVADRIRSEALSEPTVGEKRKIKAWEIVLLILGAPLWITLAVVAAIVVITVYIVLWAVVVAFWAVVAALACTAAVGLVSAVAMLVTGALSSGALLLGASLMCFGLAMLGLLGCIAISKGILRLSVKLARLIKASFKSEVKGK